MTGRSSSAPAPTPPPKTVLIVDDEASLRRALERALARHGYRVLGVGSGEDAYQLLATEAVDAVLLDVHLPMISGLSLYLAITNRWPRLTGRIALMTGAAEPEEIRSWVELHHCPVIRKPFNLSEVTEWLRRVVHTREPREGNGEP
jgi:DNA-binding response OmpR family regulator